MSLRDPTGEGLYPKPNPPGPTNPYEINRDIQGYEQSQYSYPVELMKQRQMFAQSFDPYRQGAIQSINAGVSSGEQTAASQLASSGGLSQADKQALAAQSQRQRVGLQQGGQAAYDQMEAQNMYDTNQANAKMSAEALDINQQILNQRARDMAAEMEKKATNIYTERLKEAVLERKMATARYLASKQAEGA